MTKEEFYNLVDNPSSSVDFLSQMTDFVQKYPFASSFHVLSLAGFKVADDLNFQSELQESSLYISDHCALFYLLSSLNKKPLKSNTVSTSVSSSATAVFHEEDISEVSANDADNLMFGSVIGDFLKNSEENNESEPSVASSTKDSPVRLHSVDTNSQQDSYEEQSPVEKDVPHEFFTETLAKIYIKQQKFDKAISIFKKLSIEHPEKSSIFADQIRFLEKLIKNL